MLNKKTISFLCVTRSLPHDYKEQEIIVIDMCYNLSYASIKEDKKAQDGIDEWWVNSKQGYVNHDLLGVIR
ncbi:hypothetical protein [Nostoc sp.]